VALGESFNVLGDRISQMLSRERELLAGNPWVDRILVIRLEGGMRSVLRGQRRKNWRGVARTLRKLRFDVAIDLQGLVRSGLIAYLSGAPIRIGFPREYVRETLNGIFTNLRPRDIPSRGHVIDRNLALLHPLGIRTRRERFPLWEPLGDERGRGRHPAGRRGGGDSLRIVVNPAAGWITKQWSPRRYAELADRIAAEWDATVFILWGPGEKGLAEQVRGRMQRAGRLAPEMGISALADFLRGCDLFIGGDSGPLHMASALGVPVLGLYGPSDPVRNGPFRAVDRVVSAATPCGPCYRRACARAWCMDAIPAAQVWETVKEMVRGLGNG
jgi:ADP-heptose:LPS heptosyltransferase